MSESMGLPPRVALFQAAARIDLTPFLVQSTKRPRYNLDGLRGSGQNTDRLSSPSTYL